MQAIISSNVLRRLKLEHIDSTDLTNFAFGSMGPFVMNREKIDREHFLENIVLRSPSVCSFMLVKRTVPLEQTDRRRYSTSVILL
ncbi:hypothetical protein QL285_033792 [Trifolium repens]|nr:hypothetical protein QL285_033792 [Trifolium repens]